MKLTLADVERLLDDDGKAKRWLREQLAEREALRAEVERLQLRARVWFPEGGGEQLLGSAEDVEDRRRAAAAEMARLRAEVERLRGMVEQGPVPPACSVEDWADAQLRAEKAEAEVKRLRQSLALAESMLPPPRLGNASFPTEARDV